MAYVIGSEKGKKIAEEMKAGDTYKASDGSVWTKENDGSVTVRTMYEGKEYTYKNAYTPTTSTSGGTNSPYTKPSYVSTGTYLDSGLPSTAKAEIQKEKDAYNAAMAAGDTEAAKKHHARAEEIRAMWGYSGGADGSEYIELDTPKETGRKTYAQPVYPKDTMDAEDVLDWYEDYNNSNPQPTYESKYDAETEALIREILNRDDFSYDVASDPLYQQIAAMYQREGDRAMRNTLAEIASGAGGMNSYAVSAAQQAANYYNSQLNDRIPELFQLAYSMYLDDKESMIEDLGLLQGMDATEYARFRDMMNDYRNDKNFAYGVFQDAVNRGDYVSERDYNVDLNNRDFLYNDAWQNKQWDANQGQIEIENERNDRESAKEDVQYYIALGAMPSAELIARAGLNEADVRNAVSAAQVKNKSKNSEDEETSEVIENDTAWTKGISDLGLPMVLSADILVELDEAGAIYEENGMLKWNDGWNAQNYQRKLAERPNYLKFF